MFDTSFHDGHMGNPIMDPALLGDWSHHESFSPWNGNGDLIIGSPASDVHDYVHQSTPFTCAVVSQEMILHDFGVNVSEAQLVYDATVHGWLTNKGTLPNDAANLLEYYGVHTHTHCGADIETLAAELARGHKVIVSVDSADLWGEKWAFEDWFHQAGADHAIVVTGINMADPKHPLVIVNDPGHPDGAGHSYPLDQFLHAWSASGRFYVATDEAPPHLAEHAIFGPNFDMDTGMYMDGQFWKDLIVDVAGVGASLLVLDLLRDATHKTDAAPATVHTAKLLSDAERNQLFVNI